MKNILLVSGHPDLKQSVANAGLLKKLAQVDNLTIRALDSLYPDYQIDVTAEQQALIDADLVILQFPLFWSTYPAVMKKWLDDICTFNFAFGPEGDKLKDKKVIVSITAGATAESYSEGDFNFMPLEPYLEAAFHPLKAAQVNITKVITTFNMNSDPNEGGDIDKVYQLIESHAEQVMAEIDKQLS